jgi:hypothetical protein
MTMDKLDKIASILANIDSDGLLNDKDLKKIVKYMIRTAKEPDSYWHTSCDYRSKDAQNCIYRESDGKPLSKSVYQTFCSKKLSHEHMVPGEVVYALLCDQSKSMAFLDSSKFSRKEFIKEILSRYTVRATITKGEAQELDKNYKNSMPDSFWKTGDAFARYRETNVYDNLIQLPANSTWETT